MKSWLTLFGCALFALPVFSQINLTFEKTDPSCFSYTNGIAIVHANGGAEPYTYHWQNGLTFNQYWGIPAGTYAVTVTDANGASVVGNVTLNHPPLMSVSIAAVDIFCEGFNGSLEAKAVGGTPPYAYSWNNGMAEAVANNITEGDWMVTVLDSKQCHDVGTRYVDIPSQIFPNIVPVDPTCATCGNGSIVVSTFGNHPPFLYEWGNGSTTNTLTGLPPGNYPLSVTDQNGCQLTFETALASPFPPIEVDVTTTNITCFNQSNGAVSAFVTGGTGVHTFLWKNQDGLIVGTDGILQNLPPGNYCVTVTDNIGTTGTDCATVAQPAELLASVNITPTPTGGTVVITATGGTPPYKMTIDGVMINSTTLNLPPKNYYYLCIMDANGCQLDIPFEILGADCLNVSLLVSSTQCNSQNTGSATAIVTAGSGNYSYTWSNGAPSLPTITGLAGGNYSVTVTDLNNPACTGTASGTVISHNTILLNAMATDASCSGVADGSATVSAFNGISPYTYSWNTAPPQTSASISGLVPGTYQVTVSDAVGCTSSAAVNVAIGAAPNAAFSVGSIVCNGANSTIQLVNNSTNYTTSIWNIGGVPFNGPTPSALEFPNNQAIIVQLTVGNATSCTDTESQPITIPAGPQISVPASVKECGTSASFNVSANPANLTYAWSPTANLDLTNPLKPVATASGTYSVTATSASGCTTTASIEVTLSPAIALSAVETPIDICDKNTSVSATATGATTYSWTLNGAPTTVTTATFASTNLNTGVNTLVVTASNGGCTETATVLVNSNPLTGLSLIGDTELCVGETGGMVSISPPPPPGSTFVWSPAASNDPTQTIPAPTASGNFPFAVTVTNAAGCTLALSLMVEVTDKIDIPVSAVNAFKPCNNRVINFFNNSGQAGTWDFGDQTATSTLASPVHIYGAAGTYTVTFKPTAECANQVTFNVVVTNADVITAAATTVFDPCSTTVNLNLKDNTAGTHTTIWSLNTVPPFTSGTSNPLPITITANGNYTATLIVTNANLCMDTLTVPVNVQNLIIPPPSLVSDDICPSECVSLNPGGNPNNYVFQWSGGLSGANPSACPPATTTYDLTVTNVNCTWTGSATVTVNPAATIAADTNRTVCSNDIINLTATGNGAFCWSFSPTFVPCVSTSGTFAYDPATMTAPIFVQTTTGNNCTATDTIIIKNGTLNITGDPAGDPIYSCLGGSKTFGVNAIPGELLTFLWSNGMTVDMLTESPTVSTPYSVTATNSAGCTDVLSFNVEVIDLQPKLSVTAMKTEVCPNEQVPLNAIMTGTSGPFTYVWTGAGLDFTDRPDPIASPTDSTTYSVTVTDAHGCTAVDDVRLRFINVTCAEPFIFLPNAFTPFDNNETNNVLLVRGNNIKDMDFYIYDRWGEKMFESHDPNVGWDGKFKDKELTPDAYGFYLRVTCDDNTTFKKQGNVTLLR